MGNLLGSVAVAGVVDEDVVAQDHRVKPTRLVLAGAVLGRGLRCQQRHVCNQRGSGSGNESGYWYITFIDGIRLNEQVEREGRSESG